MKRILITGGLGFLGRNLAVRLSERNDCATRIFDRENSSEDLAEWLLEADIVFHLAGINRPENPAEFESGNVGFTEAICDILRAGGRAPKMIFSSSIQAESNSPYGASKTRAENVLRSYAAATGARVRIYRLKNLFGKWCRPNYNSVTSTLCHNIARDLPIVLSDPGHSISLSYVDDVVDAFVEEIDEDGMESEVCERIPSMEISLGELAGKLQEFRDLKFSLVVPDFKSLFHRALYATYLSYVPAHELEQRLKIQRDARGCVAGFVRQDHFGQIFVSRTMPGITRGDHYHHTKTEKFLVVEGNGKIRMRALGSDSIKEYEVSGDNLQVVDIPPGVTHSITNVGDREMVTLFWASEVFNPDRLDTYYLPVDPEQSDRVGLGTL